MGPMWRRIGRFPVARPLTTDALLAAALAGVSVLQGWDDPSLGRRAYDATATVLTILGAVPLVVRRRRPGAAFIGCLACLAVYAWRGYFLGANTYTILLAFYTMATVYSGWWALAAATAWGFVWVGGGLAGGWSSPPALIGQSILVPAVLWKIADGAKRLAEAGAERARRAVVDERLRVARELHDVVAHHMSVIAVQAGLARYVLRTDPGTAEAALDTVLTTTGETLDELRRMLSLLRLGGEPATYEPAPGISRLPGLVEGVRAAGLAVEMVTTGVPQPLSSGIQLCVYRMVQESLTNVLKHAHAAEARVALHYADRELTVTVTDDGTAGTAGVSGTGLLGMRERATLYGGRIEAGPSPGGGFGVRAVLPYGRVT
jgi:signal transduction histidine kinase